ncbi:MAG: histone-like nucleoid-structuring protein Lsr2 [Acidimicrobiales bacterium]
MGRKIHVVLTCDLDDDEVPAAETVSFAVNGTSYAFELCERHLGEFNAAFAGYVTAARREDDSRPSRRAGGSGAALHGGRSAGREDLAAIRSWARANGYQVSDRGRIPAEVRQAWEKEQPRS